jgi:hypothetical protein
LTPTQKDWRFFCNITVNILFIPQISYPLMQMMKLISKTVALLALTLGLKAQETASAPPAPNNKEAPSFYQFKVKDINDQEFDFATLKAV